MNMVGHHYGDVKLIFLTVIMAAGGQHDVPRRRRQDPTELGDESEEVRCEVLLQMRKVTTIELHESMLTCGNASSHNSARRDLQRVPTREIARVGADAFRPPRRTLSEAKGRRPAASIGTTLCLVSEAERAGGVAHNRCLPPPAPVIARFAAQPRRNPSGATRLSAAATFIPRQKRPSSTSFTRRRSRPVQNRKSAQLV